LHPARGFFQRARKAFLAGRSSKRVPSRAAWAILAVLLLAGCASEDPAPTATQTADVATAQALPTYGPADCANVLLFQFIDFARTDSVLPPGFHPRDPHAFLKTAAAIGQAGVMLMALRCQSQAMGPLNVSFVAVFVEAPVVDGLPPGQFDFFELARYGPATEFDGALRAAAWPAAEANVTITAVATETEGVDVTASVVDGEGEVAWVAGTAATKVNVGAGPTRFWHQTGQGLSYIEYEANLDANLGSGLCRARAGTPFAAFVGEPAVDLPLLGAVACPGMVGQAEDMADPVVAIVTAPQFNVTFHRLPGVFAG
jgi:hypothetical protein